MDSINGVRGHRSWIKTRCGNIAAARKPVDRFARTIIKMSDRYLAAASQTLELRNVCSVGYIIGQKDELSW